MAEHVAHGHIVGGPILLEHPEFVRGQPARLDELIEVQVNGAPRLLCGQEVELLHLPVRILGRPPGPMGD